VKKPQSGRAREESLALGVNGMLFHPFLRVSKSVCAARASPTSKEGVLGGYSALRRGRNERGRPFSSPPLLVGRVTQASVSVVSRGHLTNGVVECTKEEADVYRGCSLSGAVGQAWGGGICCVASSSGWTCSLVLPFSSWPPLPSPSARRRCSPLQQSGASLRLAL
jgi:hypothetical protein